MTALYALVVLAAGTARVRAPAALGRRDLGMP